MIEIYTDERVEAAQEIEALRECLKALGINTASDVPTAPKSSPAPPITNVLASATRCPSSVTSLVVGQFNAERSAKHLLDLDHLVLSVGGHVPVTVIGLWREAFGQMISI